MVHSSHEGDFSEKATSFPIVVGPARADYFDRHVSAELGILDDVHFGKPAALPRAEVSAIMLVGLLTPLWQLTTAVARWLPGNRVSRETTGKSI